MNKVIPPFRPYEFGKHENSLIFTDPDSRETWHLKPNKIQYMEKWVGYCPTCDSAYTSRWEISVPNNKIFLGTRCISYWKSINKNNPMNIEIKHCGHEESKGWLTLCQRLNDNGRLDDEV